jgi:hypothetical protein
MPLPHDLERPYKGLPSCEGIWPKQQQCAYDAILMLADVLEAPHPSCEAYDEIADMLVSHVTRQRGFVTQLIDALDVDNPVTLRAGASLVLGESYQVDTMEPLLDVVDLDFVTTCSETRMHLLNRFTAVHALLGMGRAVTLPALARLALPETLDRRLWYASLVGYAEGKENGLALMELARRRERDPERSARIAEAIARVSEEP